VENLGELVRIDLMQRFSAGFKFFERFHYRLRHPLVSLGGAADDGELLAGGEPFVAIGVV
jgi:hypothetical protein